MTPAQVLRSIRSLPEGKPHKRPLSPLAILLVGIALGAVIAVPLGVLWPWLQWVSDGMDEFAVVVIGLPILLIGWGVVATYTAWRERPTRPFDFPYILPRSRW